MWYGGISSVGSIMTVLVILGTSLGIKDTLELLVSVWKHDNGSCSSSIARADNY